MINVVLKDGAVRQVEKGVSVLEFTKTISEGLARAALVAKVNGALVDLNYKFGESGESEYTYEVFSL